MPENKSEDNNLLKKYGLSLVMVEIDRIPAHLLALARGKSGSTKIDTPKEKMKPVKTKEDLKPSLKQGKFALKMVECPLENMNAFFSKILIKISLFF
jgi:hypothetical protein